jgi:hypothetical protein
MFNDVRSKGTKPLPGARPHRRTVPSAPPDMRYPEHDVTAVTVHPWRYSVCTSTEGSLGMLHPRLGSQTRIVWSVLPVAIESASEGPEAVARVQEAWLCEHCAVVGTCAVQADMLEGHVPDTSNGIGVPRPGGTLCRQVTMPCSIRFCKCRPCRACGRGDRVARSVRDSVIGKMLAKNRSIFTPQQVPVCDNFMSSDCTS